MRVPRRANGFCPGGVCRTLVILKKATLYMPVHAFLKQCACCFDRSENISKQVAIFKMADVRQTPEGQCDRSLARSAWDIANPWNRPVGYGLILARGAHFDSVIEELE